MENKSGGWLPFRESLDDIKRKLESSNFELAKDLQSDAFIGQGPFTTVFKGKITL